MRAYQDLAFAVIAGGVAALLCVGGWSSTQYFPNHAFGDQGWSLRVNGLIDDGLTPGTDFAYAYGLLAVTINRLAFALFGASPATVGGLLLACSAVTAFAVIRLAIALRLGTFARLLLLLTLPLMVIPSVLPSPVHALEPALLALALAAQARGRPAESLAWTTAAVLVKPSLGYLLGLAYLLQILLTPRADGRNRLRGLLPATVTGLVLVGLLIGEFGGRAVVTTQWPTAGQKLYREIDCGFFFGIGREFWQPTVPPGLSLTQAGEWRRDYFITTPAGVWIVSSFLLVLGAQLALSRWRDDPAARTLVTVCGWHVLFVALFFSNPHSWTYYPYLPYIGAAVVLDRLPAWSGRWIGRAQAATFGLALGLLAATPAWQFFGPSLRTNGAEFQPRKETGGTYATPDEVAAWESLRARGVRVFVLCRMGCAPHFVAEWDSPRSWYLSPVIATRAELDWTRQRISEADCLLVPSWNDANTLHWPELADVIAPFRAEPPNPKVRWFNVYSRAP